MRTVRLREELEKARQKAVQWQARAKCGSSVRMSKR